METPSEPLTTLRSGVSTVLSAAVSFVDDPPGCEVDIGIGLLTGLISRLDGLRLRLLRGRGIVDRAVLSAEFEISRGEAAQLHNMIERLHGARCAAGRDRSRRGVHLERPDDRGGDQRAIATPP